MRTKTSADCDDWHALQEDERMAKNLTLIKVTDMRRHFFLEKSENTRDYLKQKREGQRLVYSSRKFVASYKG